jgi:hypothetical protein
MPNKKTRYEKKLNCISICLATLKKYEVMRSYFLYTFLTLKLKKLEKNTITLIVFIIKIFISTKLIK